MKVSRKIAASFFALLVIFFSATYYSTSNTMLEKHSCSKDQGIFFTSYIEQAASFFLQEKSNSSGYQGWKTETGFQGVNALFKDICEPPAQNVIRKIFVVNTYFYSPCKSHILFPFHEFL